MKGGTIRSYDLVSLKRNFTYTNGDSSIPIVIRIMAISIRQTSKLSSNRTADYQQVTPTGLPAQEWAPPGLLNAKNALKVLVNEIANFQDKKLQKEMEKLNRAADRKKPIEALEKQVTEAAAALWRKRSRLSSLQWNGVGEAAAALLSSVRWSLPRGGRHQRIQAL